MIAIIGDLHIGVRGTSKIHHANMRQVLNDFFEYLRVNKIKKVIQLGDLFDDRKSLHLWGRHFFDTVVLSKISSMGLDWYQIVGNHDSHYRETLEINTPRQVMGGVKRVTVVDSPLEVDFGDDGKFLLLPWINKTNETEIAKAIGESNAKYCCGHFEFNGFDLYRGQPARSKHDHRDLGKFSRIYSGHYHTSSERDNVVYVGTPYELTWQDCNDPKRFIVHSQDTFLTVPTNRPMYIRIQYTEGMDPPSDINGKYIRIILNDRVDRLVLNQFIHLLESQGPADLRVQENYSEELSEESADIDIVDTKETIRKFVEGSTLNGMDPEKLLDVLYSLYNEALLSDD